MCTLGWTEDDPPDQPPLDFDEQGYTWEALYFGFLLLGEMDDTLYA